MAKTAKARATALAFAVFEKMLITNSPALGTMQCREIGVWLVMAGATIKEIHNNL